VDPKYSAALFKLFDKNNDEAIDFDEFVHYIVYDPYH